MARPTPARTSIAARDIGQQLATWRKLQGLTAEQVVERAGTSRSTLRRLEQGDPKVSFETFLNVARSLGILERVVTATDPYESDIGRARADEVLPQRVRR